MVAVTCEWENDAILGEGPNWVESENAVYWLDIIGKKVHRLCLTKGEKKTWQFDFEITSIAEREQGGFVCTLRDGFAFIDFESGEVENIAILEADLPGNRFNDGKVDAQGRYYAGSMDEDEKASSGSLYRLDSDLSAHKLDQDYIITNGPAFSPDGKTAYHNDTIKRCIYAYDVAEDGSLSHRRVFVQFDDESEGYPDGMTVDADGNIWQASFAGYRITRFSPQGEVIDVWDMPVKNITSCTFGGKNLDTIYFTSARLFLTDEDIAERPLSGSLFSFKPGVKGLPTNKFKG